MKGNYNFRKERIRFTISNLKRDWGIFYSSAYGKVGFILVMIFVIISLISPLIIIHNNPNNYIVPQEDFYTAGLEKSLNVGVSNFYGPFSSTSNPDGSYLLYVNNKTSILGIEENGAIYHLLNSTNLMPLKAYSIGNYNEYLISGTLQLNTYLIDSNGTTVFIGEVVWPSGTPGRGNPSVKWSDIKANNVIDFISSAYSYSTYQSGIPEFNDETYRPAYLIIVNGSTASGFYLTSYYLSSMKQVFSIKLPFRVGPDSLHFYGSLFSTADIPNQLVLVNYSNKLLAYSMTGKLKWNLSLPADITQIYIPIAYQSISKPYNMIFSVSGNNVFGIYPENGSYRAIYTGKNSVLAISSTQGESGFPSAFIVLTKGLFTVLSAPDTISESVSIPVSLNKISSDQLDFLVYDDSGYMIMAEYLTSSQPFAWFTDLNTHISKPQFFVNPESARESIAMLVGDKLNIYSVSGKDLNPLPPTLNVPAGGPLLLGTTDHGKDVWSLFIGSFPTDLYIGVVVGIGILLISMVIGMLIGYFTGVVSSLVETFSLAVYLIPGLPLLIVVASIVGPSLIGLIAVLTFLSWPFPTFTLIGIIRSLKSRAFIEAAKISGASTMYILRKHMLPNITPILVYLTAINIGGAVAAVSTLQILGVAPLNVPTWGGMLSGFYSDYFDLIIAPWWFIPPIVALTLFIFAFIFVSRGLDEVVNPRLSQRR
ncbi:MAG: ABC transporter permease [Thermoplasma acidophilum]|nr:ABC transporter permease [Thermoplasma acidophilum]